MSMDQIIRSHCENNDYDKIIDLLETADKKLFKTIFCNIYEHSEIFSRAIREVREKVQRYLKIETLHYSVFQLNETNTIDYDLLDDFLKLFPDALIHVIKYYLRDYDIMVKLLEIYPIDLNQNYPMIEDEEEYNYNPMIAAILQLDLKTVKLLMSYGGNCNAKGGIALWEIAARMSYSFIHSWKRTLSYRGINKRKREIVDDMIQMIYFLLERGLDPLKKFREESDMCEFEKTDTITQIILHNKVEYLEPFYPYMKEPHNYLPSIIKVDGIEILKTLIAEKDLIQESDLRDEHFKMCLVEGSTQIMELMLDLGFYLDRIDTSLIEKMIENQSRSILQVLRTMEAHGSKIVNDKIFSYKPLTKTSILSFLLDRGLKVEFKEANDLHTLFVCNSHSKLKRLFNDYTLVRLFNQQQIEHCFSRMINGGYNKKLKLLVDLGLKPAEKMIKVDRNSFLETDRGWEKWEHMSELEVVDLNKILEPCDCQVILLDNSK